MQNIKKGYTYVVGNKLRRLTFPSTVCFLIKALGKFPTLQTTSPNACKAKTKLKLNTKKKKTKKKVLYVTYNFKVEFLL